jgi:hypothetical protein
LWAFAWGVRGGGGSTTLRISATAVIQLAPRSTGERWEGGEQMLSRAGGLNRGASPGATIMIVGFYSVCRRTPRSRAAPDSASARAPPLV